MANLYNRSTVSPYLNLLRQQGANSTPNYQGIVRPQFEQKRLTNKRTSNLQDLGKQVAAKKDRTNAESGEGNTKIEKSLQDRVVGDIARRMLHGTLGIGGPVVRVRTVDGHILFKKLPFQMRIPPQGENVER